MKWIPQPGSKDEAVRDDLLANPGSRRADIESRTGVKHLAGTLTAMRGLGLVTLRRWRWSLTKRAGGGG